MKTTISSSDYVQIETPPWWEIFNDINARGCSVSQIARLIGRPQSSVSYWIHNSGDVPYSVGRALINLHMRYCGHELTSVRLQKSKTEE